MPGMAGEYEANSFSFGDISLSPLRVIFHTQYEYKIDFVLKF